MDQIDKRQTAAFLNHNDMGHNSRDISLGGTIDTLQMTLFNNLTRSSPAICPVCINNKCSTAALIILVKNYFVKVSLG